MLTVTNKKPRKVSDNHKIIERFVTVEFSSKGKYFWPQEMKIAGQLIKKYGINFLLSLNPPYNRKVFSLIWFMTGDGKIYLQNEYFKFQNKSVDLTIKSSEIILEKDKIGEDVEIENKPKSLKEFLEMYK